MSAFPALVLLIFIAKPLLTILGPEFQLMALPLSFCLIIRFSELLWGPQHEILISNKKIFWDTFANVIAILIGGFVFFTSLHYWGNGIASGLFSLGFNSIAGQLTRRFMTFPRLFGHLAKIVKSIKDTYYHIFTNNLAILI